MKKIIILTSLLFAVLFVNAQRINRTLVADTVKGAETVYFTPGNEILNSDGLTGFFFKLTNTAGTINTVTLQGSYDGTNYTDIDALTAPGAGTYFLYDKIKTSVTYTSTSTATVDAVSDTVESSNTASIVLDNINPVVNFLKYRLACTGGSGDTIIVSPIRFIYKEKK